MDRIEFLRRGGQLQVKNHDGSCTHSIGWSWDKPLCFDWISKLNIDISLDDIPPIGETLFLGVPCVVATYSPGEL